MQQRRTQNLWLSVLKRHKYRQQVQITILIIAFNAFKWNNEKSRHTELMYPQVKKEEIVNHVLNRHVYRCRFLTHPYHWCGRFQFTASVSQSTYSQFVQFCLWHWAVWFLVKNPVRKEKEIFQLIKSYQRSACECANALVVRWIV